MLENITRREKLKGTKHSGEKAAKQFNIDPKRI